MPSSRSLHEMRRLRRNGEIRSSSVLRGDTMKPVVAFFGGLLLALLIANVMRPARGFEISEQAAKFALVKAINWGYSCRDKGVTLPECIAAAPMR